MKKSIITIVSVLFLLACGESPTSSNSQSSSSAVTPVNDSIVILAGNKIINSIIHKGPFNRNSDVSITTYSIANSLNKSTISQSDNSYDIDLSNNSTFSTEVPGDVVVTEIEVYGESLNEFYSSDSALSIHGITDRSFNLSLRSITILEDSVNQTNVNVITHLIALKVDDVIGTDLSLLNKSTLDSISKEVLMDLNLDTNIDVNSISYASNPTLAGQLLAVSNAFIYSTKSPNFTNYDKVISAYKNVIYPVDNNSVLDFTAYQTNKFNPYPILSITDSVTYKDITGRISPKKRLDDLTSRCTIALDTLNDYTQIRNLIGNQEISKDAEVACVNYFNENIGIFENDTIGGNYYKNMGGEGVNNWFHSGLTNILMIIPGIKSHSAIYVMQFHYCPEMGIEDPEECHNIDTYFDAFLYYNTEDNLEYYREYKKIDFE